jgi:thiol-disulfide isomerase/thioredoxin
MELVFVHRATGLTLEAAFEAELAAAEAKKQRAVVMFTADWCTPCRSIKEALESNPIVQEHTRGGRFLIIDVDEWRGPAQRLIEGADPSKLPLLVAVDRQGVALVVTHGSKIGLLDPHTTGQNLARVIHGQEIVLPSYQEDPKRRRDLAIADSRRQKTLVQDRTPVSLKVQGREKLADGRERLTVDLMIHNNEAGRRYWILPTYATPPSGPVEVPMLSGSRFKEHVRAGFFIYATDPPSHVIASGNWGSVELLGYTVEVPKGTTELKVHKLNGVTVAGEKLRFTKKVPYALKIKDASKLVAGRTLNEPRTIELDVKKSYTLSVAP